MIQQKNCPFCHTPSSKACLHLALAVEARDFVRTCVARCEGEREWAALRQQRREQRLLSGEWSPEQEDFTWLENAFCESFLRQLRLFGGMEHEWRLDPSNGRGGFWVLLWSKDPRRLWWELKDELDRQRSAPPPAKSFK